MLSLRNSIVIVALGACIAAVLIWSRSTSPPLPTPPSSPSLSASTNRDGMKSAVSGVRDTGSTPASAQNMQGYQSNGVNRQGKPWRQITMTKAELQAFPNYWMLAYSESDRAWLDRHGYPSLEEEEMLSKASMENLKALADSGNLNAGIHLGLRHSKNAMRSGDAAEFRAARRELDRALIEGGPYQSAKTVAFFAELANDRNSYGELSPATLKEMQTHLIPYHQIARGMVALYGDSAAERVGNGGAPHLDLLFGLPAQTPILFETAMRMFSNINADRVQRGLPAFSLERRPSAPGTFEFRETNVVYTR
jgi:hypothetical protein